MKTLKCKMVNFTSSLPARLVYGGMEDTPKKRASLAEANRDTFAELAKKINDGRTADDLKKFAEDFNFQKLKIDTKNPDNYNKDKLYAKLATDLEGEKKRIGGLKGKYVEANNHMVDILKGYDYQIRRGFIFNVYAPAFENLKNAHDKIHEAIGKITVTESVMWKMEETFGWKHPKGFESGPRQTSFGEEAVSGNAVIMFDSEPGQVEKRLDAYLDGQIQKGYLDAKDRETYGMDRNDAFGMDVGKLEHIK